MYNEEEAWGALNMCDCSRAPAISDSSNASRLAVTATGAGEKLERTTSTGTGNAVAGGR